MNIIFNIYSSIGFQDPVTPIMEGIIEVHNHVFFFLVLVAIFVSWWLFKILYSFSTDFVDFEKRTDYFKEVSKIKFSHNTAIEVIWTIIPSVILYFIAVPSFLLLYVIDEIVDPSITIKVIGNQWYWSYEYSDYALKYDNISFDSYMIPDYELELGQLRLLEVDNPIVLPINTHIRVIVTASDVLHCWAVPSLGIKVDAVPGRLNQGSIFLKRLGTFYGQCSEICGVNHGFMPIVVKSVKLNTYLDWITANLEE